MDVSASNMSKDVLQKLLSEVKVTKMQQGKDLDAKIIFLAPAKISARSKVTEDPILPKLSSNKSIIIINPSNIH